MDEKELRIGNWITHPQNSNNYFQVNKDTFQHPDLYRPIPITEEWLLKFGFELKKVMMGGREYEGWVNFSFHIDTNYIENTLFYHWMGDKIKLKHVHQLQNIYFALTNEELKIEL